MSILFGTPIRESCFPLERKVPVRAHKKRRNQSVAYHLRIQKKWTKRFGERVERYALQIDPAALGIMGGAFTLFDPRDVAALRSLYSA